MLKKKIVDFVKLRWCFFTSMAITFLFCIFLCFFLKIYHSKDDSYLESAYDDSSFNEMLGICNTDE